MEQVGFIGFYDKKDMLINIGKVFTYLNKKILIVDATMTQRLRYIVPNVSSNHSMTYISEYQGIDFALGFMNLMQVAQYLGKNQLDYDFILIDSDNPQTIYSFMIPKMNKIFYVTSYDRYEIEKSKELFAIVNQPLNLIKVVNSSNLTLEEDDYLVHTLQNNLIKFNEQIHVPFEDTDKNRAASLQNQLAKQTVFKRYTDTYKGSLEYLCALIAEGIIPQSDISKVIKNH